MSQGKALQQYEERASWRRQQRIDERAMTHAISRDQGHTFFLYQYPEKIGLQLEESVHKLLAPSAVICEPPSLEELPYLHDFCFIVIVTSCKNSELWNE